MRSEPQVKRVVAFIDGQNLYYAAKRAFGHQEPNYDVLSLTNAIASLQQWQLKKVCFYTGVPNHQDNAFWNQYWNQKLALMGTRAIQTFSRPLRYRLQSVKLPDGNTTSVRVGQEKGIDIRLALDIVRLAHAQEYDVALIFSQDQDLSEAVDEVKLISRDQQRWIKIASAFPISPNFTNTRGINGTDWIKIDQATYDQCLDANDYRPNTSPIT